MSSTIRILRRANSPRSFDGFGFSFARLMERTGYIWLSGQGKTSSIRNVDIASVLARENTSASIGGCGGAYFMTSPGWYHLRYEVMLREDWTV